MEGEQSKAPLYKGHSSGSLVCQLLALDALKRLWNTCYQLRLRRGKGRHADKLITHFDQTTELAASHFFTGSSLRWSSPSPFSLSTSKRNSKEERINIFLLWTYFLARKCSKGTHVRYRSKKLGINRLMAARTWVRLLTLLLNSFLSSCFCGVLSLFLHLVLIGPETGQSGCFLV